jgi:hypothetical protein
LLQGVASGNKAFYYSRNARVKANWNRGQRETISYGWKNPPLYKGRMKGYFGKIFKPPQPLLIKEGIELFTEGLPQYPV